MADALSVPSLFSPPHEPVLRRPPTAQLPPVVETRKRWFAEGEKNWGSSPRNYRHYLYRNMMDEVIAAPPPEALRKPTPLRWGGATIGSQARPGYTMRSGPPLSPSMAPPLLAPWVRHNPGW